jgi:thiol-disulfide isomerase/thioredoxin
MKKYNVVVLIVVVIAVVGVAPLVWEQIKPVQFVVSTPNGQAQPKPVAFAAPEPDGQEQSPSEEFVLPDLNGQEQSLGQYRGKWVVVAFWATWCAPCVEEIPDLKSFHSRHQAKDAVVVGVNMESIELEKLRLFVNDHAINYPVWHMEPVLETPLGKVFGLPTTYLINRTGEVVAREMGAITAEEIEAFIQRYESRESEQR